MKDSATAWAARPASSACRPPEFYTGDLRNAVSRTRNADGSYLLYIIYDPATTRFDPSISNYVRDAVPE